MQILAIQTNTLALANNLRSSVDDRRVECKEMASSQSIEKIH